MADQLRQANIARGDLRTLRDVGLLCAGVTVVTCHDSEGRQSGLQTAVGVARSALATGVYRQSPAARRPDGSAILINADRAAASIDSTATRTVSDALVLRRGRAPILEESLGVFECESYSVYDGGDHHILVGRVVKASFDPTMDPLLYFRGKYRRLHFD
jgi:flavin reductase (DIM6/NTAB) family NADH-FMN oxidoreductase RutF